MPLRLLLTAVLSLTAACFDAPAPNCSLACGELGACPDGYVCGDGNLCHLLGDDGSLAACPELVVDAAGPDAPPAPDAAP
jgi:hypothetical protein